MIDHLVEPVEHLNLGNLHDQDTYPMDEFEEAQQIGLDLDEDGWPVMF